MMPAMREARDEDLPEIRDLLVATWHATYDAHYGAERVTEITGRWHSVPMLRRQLGAEGSSFPVAIGEGRIVATGYGCLNDEGELYISRIYVDVGHQGRGIGRALLDYFYARFPDATSVRLEVEAENRAAIGFYEHLGFEGFDAAGGCGPEGDGFAHKVMTRPLVPNR